MLYTRFQPIAVGRWAALSEAKPVAEVAINKAGRCAVATNHAVSRDQLASVLEFMKDREERAKGIRAFVV